MKETNYSNMNNMTVGEFLDIYSENIQKLMCERLHYYVSNGKILCENI